MRARPERLAAGGLGLVVSPKIAITPSPMNLSSRPPAASIASPMARK